MATFFTTRRLLDAILLVCLAVTIVRLVIGPSTASLPMEVPALTVGSRAPVSSGLLTERKTVVLHLSHTCQWCVRSLPFYRQIIAVTKRDDIGIVVTTSDPVESVRQWLSAEQMDDLPIVEVEEPAAVGIVASPTLMIVDRTGHITDLSVGFASPETEARLLTRMTDDTAAAVNNLPVEMDLHAALGGQGAEPAQILEVGARSADPVVRGALRIPFDEIRTRATAELDMDRRVVVACGPGWQSRCRSVGLTLTELGFMAVTIGTTR
jgi:hypothetical protein